jgi:hypothetical protein
MREYGEVLSSSSSSQSKRLTNWGQLLFEGARAGNFRGSVPSAKENTVARSFSSICQYLSRDRHPKIEFAAVRTDYVLERTILGLLPDAEERKDLTRSVEAKAAEVLAATISENDPASPCYQAGLRDHGLSR